MPGTWRSEELAPGRLLLSSGAGSAGKCEFFVVFFTERNKDKSALFPYLSILSRPRSLFVDVYHLSYFKIYIFLKVQQQKSKIFLGEKNEDFYSHASNLRTFEETSALNPTVVWLGHYLDVPPGGQRRRRKKEEIHPLTSNRACC